MRRNPGCMLALAAGALLFLHASSASATIIKGSRSFADTAFADFVVSATPPTFGDPNDVLGSDLTTSLALGQTGSCCGAVTVAFTDNALVNGPGIDLLVYTTGTSVAVTIGVVTVGVAPVDEGFSEGGQVFASLFDLDDFGLGAGAQVTQLTVDDVGQGIPTVRAIGALNSVPEPAAFALLLAAAFVLAGRSRSGASAASRDT